MFNLQKYLFRGTNYNGIQGYWATQTRAWQNCVGCKQKHNKSAQEAWEECLNEYQKGDGALGWISKYIPCEESDGIQKLAQTIMGGGYQLQMGSYWERIKKKQKQGKTTGEAVMETLQECQKDARKIPSK